MHRNIMPYLSILFPDENQKEITMQKKSNCLSQDVVRDLAITGILDDIKQTTTDYPDVFLLFPPFDYATLCFRREIAEEVYSSHVIFEDLKRFTVDLYALQKQRSNTYRITNKEAKNHSFLCDFLTYCKLLKRLTEITESAQSRGLRSLHDMAQQLFGKIENGSCEKAKELFERVEDMLKLSVKFDFINHTVKIAPQETVQDMKKLSDLCESVFGAELDFSFSAVNNVQFSPFEEMLLNVLKMRSPNVFRDLESFYEENKSLDFNTMIDMRYEILFYTGYIEFVKKYEKAGFRFSFAEMSHGEISARGIFDIGLAIKLGSSDRIVENDIEIKKGDIFVVSGANQGGKTTFLRAFGQCAFLAAQGLPVPAVSFVTPFWESITTHFNHKEQLGKSRLEDEIVRVKTMITAANDRCLMLFNECFTGTRHSDAVILSERLFEVILTSGATCGFVTHLYELPQRNRSLVSFVAECCQDGTGRRTFRIIKRSPYELADAHSIAVACGATYEQLLAEIE